MARIVKRLSLGMGVALALLLGLAAVGLLLPLLGLSVLGAILTSVWFWVAVPAVLLLGLFLWALRWRRSGWRVAGALAALLAAVGFTAAGLQQVEVARDADVDVNVAAVQAGDDVPDQEITYTDQDGITLPMAVYLPDEVEDAPVIMWIHGGGWISGAYDQTMHNRWLAEQGYLVVSAEYTLSDEDTHLWASTADQLRCAMGEIADYAQGQGADATRIATMGDSAGGHLALMVGYTADEGDPCGGQLPEVAAVAPIYPVASPSGFYTNDDITLGGAAKGMAGSFTGGSPEEVPEAYAAVDPLNHVDASTPPTSIIVGESDHLVPAQGSYDLAAALQAGGVETQLIRMPYGEHGMDVNVAGAAGKTYRETAVAFLQEQGLIPRG